MNAWLHFEIFPDKKIKVFNIMKSSFIHSNFSSDPRGYRRSENIELLDSIEGIDNYIRKFMTNDDTLPIRIGLYSMTNDSEDLSLLENKIRSIATEFKKECETEIVKYNINDISNATYYLYNGKFGRPLTYNSGQMVWSDGSWYELAEFISVKAMNSFLYRQPLTLPRSFEIIDKDKNEENLKLLTDYVNQTIKELGYEDLVKVNVHIEDEAEVLHR